MKQSRRELVSILMSILTAVPGTITCRTSFGSRYALFSQIHSHCDTKKHRPNSKHSQAVNLLQRGNYVGAGLENKL